MQIMPTYIAPVKTIWFIHKEYGVIINATPAHRLGAYSSEEVTNYIRTGILTKIKNEISKDT